MRAKRTLAIITVLAVLLVLVYLFHLLGNQHRYIDTTGQIVFASDQGSPGKSHIFLIHADGSAIKQLTHANSNDVDPAFSPDGSQIAYVSDHSGSPQVYIMDADGQGARAISFGSDSKSIPQYSPDGTQIAYITRGQLAVADVNTGQTQLILPSNQAVTSTSTQQLSQAARAPVLSFKWQPGAANDQIAAIQETPDGNLQTVTLVPGSGGKPKVIIGASSVSTGWSFDGSRLAVAVLGAPLGPNGQSVSGILMFQPDGSIVQQPPLAAAPIGNAGPQSPAITPDGTRIAFTIDQVNKLGTLSHAGIGATSTAPGGQVQVLVRGSAHDPEFSPDGASLLFYAPSQHDPGMQDLYAVTLSTGQGSSVTKGQGNILSAHWSPALPKGK